MPPKRSALVKSLRESFTEELSYTEVERWTTITIEEINRFLKDLQPAREALFNENYSNPSSAEKTPLNLLNYCHKYEALAQGIFNSAEDIRTVIEIRIPELKEEDNLGVAVQNAVLKKLDGIQHYLLNNSGSGGDKEGIQTPAGMFFAKEYLSSRAVIEEKILPKPNNTNKNEGSTKGKDDSSSGGSKAPSNILELKQLDYDALVKLELSLRHLLTLLRSFVNTYALNWKKLIQPRTNMETMVG